jgi:outer membrane protein assembly factor BamB
VGSALTSRPTASRTGLYVGDLDGRLHRLDKDDGGLIWTLELSLPIEASPTLLPGALLVGLADGRLLTLRETP